MGRRAGAAERRLIFECGDSFPLFAMPPRMLASLKATDGERKAAMNRRTRAPVSALNRQGASPCQGCNV